ncbi:head decoration protein [Rhodococcus globerulus]|uniref:head decoration protein n=1 Tax=Rhodococcus globerulus TaxID=33008 RepID=UPI001C579359|nr:head decoration protein [Rhodococcus globerulus]QXW04015.1 head decoration protein [Rhodococcus globerulus]
MTSTAVRSTDYQSENRSWLLSAHGTDPGANPSITLDVSKFTAGTHYPKGYVASGTVVAKVTATGLYGPFDKDATDGRATNACHLFGSLNVVGLTKVGGAGVVHGFVKESRLPAGHGLTAEAKALLPLINYTA